MRGWDPGWVKRGLRPVTFLVVRGPRTDRRSPMPGYAQETAFTRSREAFAQTGGWLAGPEAARLDHAALEEELQGRGREIQRLLLQDHLDARAACERRRAQVTGPDGICRTRAEAGHARPLSSVL